MQKNEYFIAVIIILLLAVPFRLLAQDADASQAAGSSGGASGFFLRLECGMSFPLGSSGDVLNFGASSFLELGWQLSVRPGRFGVGFETGALWESTKGDPIIIDGYDSLLIPVGISAAYDLPIAGGFRLYSQASGGLSATFVFYPQEASMNLGVLKPYFGGAFGLGLDISSLFTVRAGARFLVVFYDVNVLPCLIPEIGAELRL
jgi:hypothetical protein